MTRAYSLDIWGTLIDHSPDYSRHRDAKLRDIIAPEVPIKAFGLALRLSSELCDNDSKATGEPFDAVARATRALGFLGMAHHTARIEQVDFEAMHAVLLREHPPVGRPQMLEFVRSKHRTHPMCFASNTGNIDGDQMRVAMKRAGYPKLPGVFSNEVGVCKPDARFFAVVARTLKADPADVTHIGDDAVADISGARAFGMEAQFAW